MNASPDIEWQKYPKPVYLCGVVDPEMNIQIFIVLLLFALAVFFTARKMYRSFSKKKSPACAHCSADEARP